MDNTQSITKSTDNIDNKAGTKVGGIKKKPPGLSTGSLKLIACISMLIDHFAATILQYRLFGHGKLSLYNIWPGLTPDMARDIIAFLRLLGRPAFLIYAFFLTFGFTKTRSKWKYFLRLLILGIISEVPFDMALYGEFVNWNYQNVFFNLAIGLGTIWLIDICLNRVDKLKADLTNTIKARNLEEKNDADNKWTKTVNSIKLSMLWYILLCFLIFLVGVIVADAFKTDYYYMGITAFTIIYLFNRGYKYGSLFLVIAAVPIEFISGNVIYFGKILMKFITGNAQSIPNINNIVQTCFNFLFRCLMYFTFCSFAFGLFLLIWYFTKNLVIRNTRLKGRPEKVVDYFYSSLLGSLYLLAVNPYEASAFVGSLFIQKFNGEKGWNNKWFFYFFYPVHLLILGLIMVYSK